MTGQLAKLAQQVANRRKDYAHKVAAALARRYRCLAVEDLKIACRRRGFPALARELSDAPESEAGFPPSLD